jgi:hypothetical protein
MLTCLLWTALAGPTRVLPDAETVQRWVRRGDQQARTELPVVGPASVGAIVEAVDGDLRFFTVDPSQDPDRVAVDARLDRGSPCALVLAEAEEGWLGWMSGACGMLSATGWRVEGPRVLDGLDVPVRVATFATVSGDPLVLRTHRRLERTRERALWAGVIGLGFFFGSSIDLASNPSRTRSRYLQVGGGAIALGSIGAMIGLHANPRSRPTRIGAHYTDAEMRERVRDHNVRLGIAERTPARAEVVPP